MVDFFIVDLLIECYALFWGLLLLNLYYYNLLFSLIFP